MFYGFDSNDAFDPARGESQTKQSAIVGIDGFIIGGVSRSRAEPGAEEDLDLEADSETDEAVRAFKQKIRR
jgi:hypothetical protein